MYAWYLCDDCYLFTVVVLLHNLGWFRFYIIGVKDDHHMISGSVLYFFFRRAVFVLDAVVQTILPELEFWSYGGHICLFLVAYVGVGSPGCACHLFIYTIDSFFI